MGLKMAHEFCKLEKFFIVVMIINATLKIIKLNLKNVVKDLNFLELNNSHCLTVLFQFQMGINSVRNVVVDFPSYLDIVANQVDEFTKKSKLILSYIFELKSLIKVRERYGIALDFYYPIIFDYQKRTLFFRS